jgi:uncharacterized protein (DUF2342 family)
MYGDGVDPVEDELIDKTMAVHNLHVAIDERDKELAALRAQLAAAEAALAQQKSAVGWLKEAVAFRDAALERAREDAFKAVEKALKEYHCTQQRDFDDNALDLADALTPEHCPTIKEGQQEIVSLLDAICGEIDAALTAPVAEPECAGPFVDAMDCPKCRKDVLRGKPARKEEGK